MDGLVDRVSSGSDEPWFKAWRADRKARGYTTVGNSIGHYTKHIVPSIGDKSVKAWTPAELRKLCADLDAKVVAGARLLKISENTPAPLCEEYCGSPITITAVDAVFRATR
jgi:hypothetical protein